MSRGSRFLFNKAVEHAQGHTYDRLSDVVGPYARVAVEAGQAGRAASRWYQATSEIKADARVRDDRNGNAPRVTVGGEIFHGPADRQHALAALTTDYTAFQNDLALTARAPADLDWACLVVAPVLADWARFVGAVRANTLSAYTLEWSAIEEWYERLVRLRELARTRGIALVSPEPVKLPRTIWERGGSGTGSVADTAVSFLKVGVLAVVAVTGFVGFFSVIRTWKGRSAASSTAREEALEAVAREKGFASAADFEDAVVATAADLKRKGATIGLAPDLEHLHPRVNKAAKRRPGK